MIERVSQQSMVTEFSSNSMDRQVELTEIENSLSDGYAVRLPEDDPANTVNNMDYSTKLSELNVYSEIIGQMSDKIDLVDSQLSSATDLIQRARELAVQLANGIYEEEDRVNAAMEVDQINRELLSIANGYFTDSVLFGGTATQDTPFIATYENDPETGSEFLASVSYVGNEQSQIMQIERGENVTIIEPGNQVFWASNMMIIPGEPSTGYVAPQDSTIYVDGIGIEITAGDNLEVIAEKINDSGAAVTASLVTTDMETTFMMESTDAHQITLRDADGGSVLSDLGLIDSGAQPPNNYSTTAYVNTGSIFEAMVDFREALMDNDTDSINTALGKMDDSLDNILTKQARLGSVSERMDVVLERYMNDEIYYTDLQQNAIGTDITEATMRMKLLEFANEVALNVGARLMPQSLLDFLR